MDTKPSTIGRPEILTEEAARKVCKLIERMPDAGIAVSWNSVALQVERALGIAVQRQTLSQKEWGGRKLIAEAFDLAKDIQRRKRSDSIPKYGTASRAVLQQRVAELETKNLALQDQLEQVRAQQMRHLDAFLLTRLDLREVLQTAQLELLSAENSAAVTQIRR